MKPVAHRLVQVDWTGPFTIQHVRTDKIGSERGLYQLSGQHIVFGPDSLLYIGMTGSQTFARRLTQHYDRWLRNEVDVVVRLGAVVPQADGSDVLTDVEALTIWWHSPPYNSKNIWRYEGQPLWIQNQGARGRLLPEYSSHWTTDRTPPDEGGT